MRLVGTIVAAAVLLFLLWMLVAGVAAYFGGHLVPGAVVPDSWSTPNRWAEWRDIAIVFTAFFWVLGGLLLVVLMVVLIFLAVEIRRVLRENAVPAIDSLKDSLDNLRGTTEFAGETVASPIIRTYAVIKGVRTGVGAITNLPGRISARRKKGRK
jgi:hypothetical protein